jgi:hypothetical protein
MATGKGYTDTDKGLNEILDQIALLGKLAVKIGFPEESTGKEQGKKRLAKVGKTGKKLKKKPRLMLTRP